MNIIFNIILLLNAVAFPKQLSINNTYQNCNILQDISNDYPTKNSLNYYLAIINEQDTIVILSKFDRCKYNIDISNTEPIKLNTNYCLYLQFRRSAFGESNDTFYKYRLDLQNLRKKVIGIDIGVFRRKEFENKELLFLWYYNSLINSKDFYTLYYFTDDIVNGRINKKLKIE